MIPAYVHCRKTILSQQGHEEEDHLALDCLLIQDSQDWVLNHDNVGITVAKFSVIKASLK